MFMMFVLTIFMEKLILFENPRIKKFNICRFFLLEKPYYPTQKPFRSNHYGSNSTSEKIFYFVDDEGKAEYEKSLMLAEINFEDKPEQKKTNKRRM